MTKTEAAKKFIASKGFEKEKCWASYIYLRALATANMPLSDCGPIGTFNNPTTHHCPLCRIEIHSCLQGIISTIAEKIRISISSCQQFRRHLQCSVQFLEKAVFCDNNTQALPKPSNVTIALHILKGFIFNWQ